MEETRSSQRLGFTIGIVAVVLVLVRLIVGTPEEDSSLNRAATAQLAAAGDDQGILSEPAPEAAPAAPVPEPAPPPPVDEDVLAMDAVPDEELIDDASGSDPSDFSDDAPVERRVGGSTGPSGPLVPIDRNHN